jgi:hypothetical protein
MGAAATFSSEVADLQDVPLSDLNDALIEETIARILLITPAPVAAFQSAI